MAFYIQKEEELPLNISVQIDDDQDWRLVPETPHIVESQLNVINIHVPNFQRQIIGNGQRAVDDGIYLVSLLANGDLEVWNVGRSTTTVVAHKVANYDLC